MKNYPILIVEDNPADRLLIQLAFKQAKVENELVMANSGEEAVKILKRRDFKPFIIISDVQMTGMSGFDLKDTIDNDKALKKKCIPFIFMSSSVLDREVQKAFDMHAHGYFPKQDFEDQTKVINLITNYWKESEHPKSKTID